MSVPSTSPSGPGAALFATTSNLPELYERLLVGPLFGPWAERLLDRMPLAGTARVLDVACGTGIVSRLARRRLGDAGRIVAVDLSPGMLAVARGIEPAIDWREGSADRLPVGDDERFDAVLCQQGMQFFPDRAAAAREMRRVLAPGGRVGVAVWRSLEENELFRDLGAIGERFVGPIVDQRHAFGDADALAGLLREAGLSDVRVEPVTLEVRFPDDPAALARINAMALVGMSAVGKTLGDAERAAAVAAITEASLDALARYARDRAIVSPTSANIATAHA
jgi:ubiquinone/menaquinone biosynthesis C-methylase UbiE